MTEFPAFIAEDQGNGRVSGSVKTLTLDKLPAGDVTIDIEYSSLNFKDALASTGQNKIAAGYPHVPGIDCAGTVADSAHPAWKRGDRVLVHAYDFGAGRFGGYARYGRVPAEWVVRIPDALSTFEAMAIGTAGYTAAMALLAIELNGVKPTDGPVLVTGIDRRRRLSGGGSVRGGEVSGGGEHGEARAPRVVAQPRRERDPHA